MRLLCSLVLAVLLVTLTGAAAVAPSMPGHHDDQIQAP